MPICYANIRNADLRKKRSPFIIYQRLQVTIWRFPEIGLTPKSTLELLGYPHDYGHPHVIPINPYNPYISFTNPSFIPKNPILGHPTKKKKNVGLVPVHLRRAMTIDEGDHITASLPRENLGRFFRWFHGQKVCSVNGIKGEDLANEITCNPVKSVFFFHLMLKNMEIVSWHSEGDGGPVNMWEIGKWQRQEIH